MVFPQDAFEEDGTPHQPLKSYTPNSPLGMAKFIVPGNSVLGSPWRNLIEGFSLKGLGPVAAEHFSRPDYILVVDGGVATIQTKGVGGGFTLHITPLDWLACSLFGIGPRAYMVTWLQTGGVVHAGTGPRGPRPSMTFDVTPSLAESQFFDWIRSRIQCSEEAARAQARGLCHFVVHTKGHL